MQKSKKYNNNIMFNKKLTAKKSFLLFFLFFSFSEMEAQKRDEFSHWSMALKAGVDYYMVYPKGSNLINDASRVFPVVVLEYNFNSVSSAGISFDYLMYNRTHALGNTKDFSAFYSCNFLNLILPNRNKLLKNTNAYFNIGGGVAYYYYNINNNDSKNTFSPVGILGLSLEQNMNKTFALNVEGQYRHYAKNNLGGESSGRSWGNVAFVATVGLRYKFNSVEKNHWRNKKGKLSCMCSSAL